MTDRPILFSAPMVRALLAGTKSQTRRVLTPQPPAGFDWILGYIGVGCTKAVFADADKGRVEARIRIEKGDRLWVRETWQGLSFGDYLPTKSSQCEVRYAATDPCADLDAEARGYPWRPSIFMPRWASRLTLTVTDVRVERLQSISEGDALAEGIQPWNKIIPFGVLVGTDAVAAGRTAALAYRTLWNHINGADAWEANPWIVAYTFSVHRGNIDQIGGAA